MTILDLLENFKTLEEINNRYNARQEHLNQINEKIKSIKEESGDK